jgi:hypothetical protein
MANVVTGSVNGLVGGLVAPLTAPYWVRGNGYVFQSPQWTLIQQIPYGPEYAPAATAAIQPAGGTTVWRQSYSTPATYQTGTVVRQVYRNVPVVAGPSSSASVVYWQPVGSVVNSNRRSVQVKKVQISNSNLPYYSSGAVQEGFMGETDIESTLPSSPDVRASPEEDLTVGLPESIIYKKRDETYMKNLYSNSDSLKPKSIPINILGFTLGSESFVKSFDPVERVTAVLVRFSDEIRAIEQNRVKQDSSVPVDDAVEEDKQVVPLDNRRFQILLADLTRLEDNIRAGLSNAAANRQWRVWLRLNPILVLTRNIRRTTERLRSRMVYVSTLATMERLANEAVEQFANVALSGTLTEGVPLSPLVTVEAGTAEGGAPSIVLHRPPVRQSPGSPIVSAPVPVADQPIVVPVVDQVQPGVISA